MWLLFFCITWSADPITSFSKWGTSCLSLTSWPQDSDWRRYFHPILGFPLLLWFSLGSLLHSTCLLSRPRCLALLVTELFQWLVELVLSCSSCLCFPCYPVIFIPRVRSSIHLISMHFKVSVYSPLYSASCLSTRILF